MEPNRLKVERTMTIRICTWNIGGALIRSDRGLFEIEDIDYFCHQFSKIEADIICVQEAHSGLDGSLDQLTLLASALNLPHFTLHVLSPSHLKPATNAGIGIASRYRVLERGFLPLPNPGWTGRGPDGSEWTTFDKGFLVLVLEVSGRRFRVVTGHDFPYRAFARSEESPDLVAIHANLNTLLLRSASELPTIFTGDLNIQQPSRCLPALCEPIFRRVIPSGPTTQPWGMQFDHIYATESFQVRASAVVPGEADHFLCWSDLEFHE